MTELVWSQIGLPTANIRRTTEGYCPYFSNPSTLSRVESGKMPDMETFLALCNWLEVPPAELFRNMEDHLDTPEMIAIQLRADKNLDPAIANALASLVKAAYHDLSQSSGGTESQGCH